ncbi:MAG: hypothetical protein PHV76_08975, partial [Bacteroidales bacterium]|nr:hypothetical protein [Bacteroidales bacterium]
MRVRNIFLIVLFSFSINCVFAQEKEINYSSDIEGTLKDNGRMIVVFSSANTENIVFNSTISS